MLITVRAQRVEITLITLYVIVQRALMDAHQYFHGSQIQFTCTKIKAFKMLSKAFFQNFLFSLCWLAFVYSVKWF